MQMKSSEYASTEQCKQAIFNDSIINNISPAFGLQLNL